MTTTPPQRDGKERPRRAALLGWFFQNVQRTIHFRVTPSTVAVTLHTPLLTAVTLPLPSTVATAGFSEFQVRASAAPAGSWAEQMVPLAPGASSRLPGDSVT